MKRIYAAVATIGAAMGLTWAPPVLASEPAMNELSFRVILDNKQIGHHTFKISEAGDTKVVDISANFDVKILFITAYSYLHRNTEIWQDGCLQAEKVSERPLSRG